MYSFFENNSTIAISDYVGIYVSVTDKSVDEDGTADFDSKRYEAVLCQEAYPEDQYPDLNRQFINDLSPDLIASTEWLCLPPGTFKVFNDALTQENAISTSFIVNYCSVTA